LAVTKQKRKAVESHIFDGMKTAVTEQAQAAVEHNAAELTARLIEDRPTIDARAGEMERNSPLFFGTIHPTLF
jgi:hypothetical protein